jgi:hypothetical protein
MLTLSLSQESKTACRIAVGLETPVFFFLGAAKITIEVVRLADWQIVCTLVVQAGLYLVYNFNEQYESVGDPNVIQRERNHVKFQIEEVFSCHCYVRDDGSGRM